MQGTGWHIRAVDGDWRDVREDGWHHSQGYQPVRSFLASFVVIVADFILLSAYLGVGIFAVCPPDVPCITPGTYALLGAAAALSGVMRLTVTVVVIMFELTGALTYILPTMVRFNRLRVYNIRNDLLSQIVLLVTKAVGDFLGTTGIAEEMIRFNGFPFLEKDDHAYNVPVSRVMRRDLKTLPVSGLSVKEIGVSPIDGILLLVVLA